LAILAPLPGLIFNLPASPGFDYRNLRLLLPALSREEGGLFLFVFSASFVV